MIGSVRVSPVLGHNLAGKLFGSRISDAERHDDSPECVQNQAEVYAKMNRELS